MHDIDWPIFSSSWSHSQHIANRSHPPISNPKATFTKNNLGKKRMQCTCMYYLYIKFKIKSMKEVKQSGLKKKPKWKPLKNQVNTYSSSKSLVSSINFLFSSSMGLTRQKVIDIPKNGDSITSYVNIIRPIFFVIKMKLSKFSIPT